MPLRDERPTTYGGVLTTPAATVVATLCAIGMVLALGWKLRDVIGAAEAAQSTPAVLDRRLDKIDRDMLLIKCRLGIENVCPPPVNVSGIGR